MLASLLTLPSAALNSTTSFISSRRRTLQWIGGTAGAVYCGSRWIMDKVEQSADKGTREGWARQDLERRFDMTLADANYTTRALLPTLSSQISAELDVEARTAELGRRAREEREVKMRAEQGRLEKEAQGRLEEEPERGKAGEDLVNGQREITTNGQNGTTCTGGSDVTNPNGSTEEPESQQITPLAPRPATLDPTAASFTPSSLISPSSSDSSPPPSATVDSAHDEVPSADRPNGAIAPVHAAIDGTERSATPGAEKTETEADKPSWASVVKRNTAGAQSMTDTLVSNGAVTSTPPEVAPAPSRAVATTSEPERSATAGSVLLNGTQTDRLAEEQTPLIAQTKAELWCDIKVLTFTRLLSTIYTLTFLTLLTHTQLSLLGRSSYLHFLLASVPPPSPRSQPVKPQPLSRNSFKDDLERMLFAEQTLPPTDAEQEEERERQRKETEQLYLTFSYWLLHDGWKVVEARARPAVEAVVGPMGLKTQLVYGEVSALFGELRRRVETDFETGEAIDFSAAFLPPTPALEVQTLIAGGSYVPFSSPSTTPSSPSYPPFPSSPSPSPMTPPLRTLLSETADTLSSPDSALIRSLLLDRLFSLVIEQLEPAFAGRKESAADDGGRGARFEDVTERTARVVDVLPVLTRLSGNGEGSLLGGEEGRQVVEALTSVSELCDLCAVMYSSWDPDGVRIA